MPENGSYLGIDYGLERTGLALSDPSGKIAFPLSTLELRKAGSRKVLLEKMASIAQENLCCGIVIGLPLHMDGTENEMCRCVRNFAKRLMSRLNIPVYFMPENLSSEEARAELREAGLSGDKLKSVLDQQAAKIILQNFLDNLSQGDCER